MPSRRLAACFAIRLAALLAASLACWPAQAAERPVRLGCVEFPPLSYSDPEGRPTGRVVEMVAGLLRRIGMEWSGQCYPGARLMASLKDGTADFATLIRHPEIIDHTLYGRLPVALIDLDAWRRKDRPPVGGIEGLKGKSVIVLRGYGYGGMIDWLKDPANGLTLNYADSHAAALKMLANGHGDYLVDYRGPAETAQAENQLPGLEREVLRRLDVYFVVSKKAPQAELLLHRLEEAFKASGARPVVE